MHRLAVEKGKWQPRAQDLMQGGDDEFWTHLDMPNKQDNESVLRFADMDEMNFNEESKESRAEDPGWRAPGVPSQDNDESLGSIDLSLPSQSRFTDQGYPNCSEGYQETQLSQFDDFDDTTNRTFQ